MTFHSNVSMVTSPVVNKKGKTPVLSYYHLHGCLCLCGSSGRVTVESGIKTCRHVPIKHIILDSLYSLWLLVSASSLSILFASNLIFSTMTAEMTELKSPLHHPDLSLECPVKFSPSCLCDCCSSLTCFTSV